MDVYALPAGQSAKAALRREIVGLIDSVGRPKFSPALFKFANACIRADHVTAFAFDSSRDARIIFAENKGTKPVAKSVADRYVTDYWHFDPAEARNKSSASKNADSWAVKTSVSDIEHTSYRASCYTAVDLDSRLSIFATRGDRTIRLSFYRRPGDDFSEDDVTHVLESGDLLMALVWRHGEESSSGRQHHLDAYFRERLLAVAPALSGREREVCAMIARGMTSEGIGLQLKIGLSTVHTYRKRAYARLNISSQNELMRLILT